MKNEQNPYYFWYEFLKLSEPYKKCCERGGTGRLAKTYRDYGDVHSMDFKEWWNWIEVEGGFFGLIENDFFLHVIKDEKEFNEYNDEYGIILTVNLFQPKQKLLQAFDDLIDKVRPTKAVALTKKGRLPYETFAAIRFDSRPDTNSLATTLRVYKAWLEDKGKNRYELGKETKASSTHLVKTNDDPETIRKKKIKMGITVRRYITDAENIIKNVERGKFPKRTYDKAAKPAK